MAMALRHMSLGTASVGLSAPPPTAGVLTGVSRTTYSGGMTITTNGTTITDKNIGSPVGDALNVNAANVTISNCYILCGDYFAINGDFVATTGLTVDHCTIDGGSIGGNSCVLTGNNWTITNCVLTGFENGIMVQGGTGLAEGNYIHGLDNTASGDPHIDGIQIQGPASGVMIRNNWIEAWDTSCVFIQALGGAIVNVTITGNTLINDPVKGATAATIYSESNAFNTTGTLITNNRMQPGFAGDYINTSGGGATPTTTGNVNYNTGAAVP